VNVSLTQRCREALAVSGIYQRLGVASENIYFKPTQGDDGSFHPVMVADVEGKVVEWQIPIYGGTDTIYRLLAEWGLACVYWNSLPNTARIVLVDESESFQQAPDFLNACAMKGLVFHGDDQKAVAI
jgi:hypothetical protein